MQKRTTNRKAGEFAANHKPFKGSNLEGRWEGRAYVVVSYGWYPIFVYDSEEKAWYRTNKGYSMSTKRQISEITKKLDNSNFTEIEHENLKKIISKLTN